MPLLSINKIKTHAFKYTLPCHSATGAVFLKCTPDHTFISTLRLSALLSTALKDLNNHVLTYSPGLWCLLHTTHLPLSESNYCPAWTVSQTCYKQADPAFGTMKTDWLSVDGTNSMINKSSILNCFSTKSSHHKWTGKYIFTWKIIKIFFILWLNEEAFLNSKLLSALQMGFDLQKEVNRQNFKAYIHLFCWWYFSSVWLTIW